MKSEKMISLSEPVLGRTEKEALCEVIDSGWVTMGERVTAFEAAFAGLHGVKGAVAVSSCTAGLHLVLAALGIGAGDEVLVPSLTFVASINAVVYVGANPVFVDIVSNTRPLISIKDAELKCTPRTKAVVVMHYGGYLVDLERWQSFTRLHDLKLIEDAAHAPGLEGVGRLSQAAVFSFFTNKNITTAEGGMVLSNASNMLERIAKMRSHGMTSLTLDRYRGHAHTYDVTLLGYNYRMDELRAAIGLVQLKRLSQWNDSRRRLSGHYRQRLAEKIPQITVPFDKDHPTAAHLMPILLPEYAGRKDIMRKLRSAGIQSSIHYPAAHLFSFFRQRQVQALPLTEAFSARELSLPLHPGLSPADVDRIVFTLQRTLS